MGCLVDYKSRGASRNTTSLLLLDVVLPVGPGHYELYSGPVLLKRLFTRNRGLSFSFFFLFSSAWPPSADHWTRSIAKAHLKLFTRWEKTVTAWMQCRDLGDKSSGGSCREDLSTL